MHAWVRRVLTFRTWAVALIVGVLVFLSLGPLLGGGQATPRYTFEEDRQPSLIGVISGEERSFEFHTAMDLPDLAHPYGFEPFHRLYGEVNENQGAGAVAYEVRFTLDGNVIHRRAYELPSDWSLDEQWRKGQTWFDLPPGPHVLGIEIEGTWTHTEGSPHATFFLHAWGADVWALDTDHDGVPQARQPVPSLPAYGWGGITALVAGIAHRYAVKRWGSGPETA